LLAEQLANSSRGVADLGGIPGRVQRQRESDLQTAEASLESILDQVEFDARRESDQATAAHRLAAQQLMVARQELNSILGPASDVTVELADAEEMTEPTLSRVALRAPIEGTIQDRLLSNSERVAAGQVILVIADTTNLWVEADVRENDWLAMEVDLGQPVEVLLPAIPDRQFVANILIVGRRINTSTGAAQLVARLQQTDARLRPGLFARMIVPHGQPRRLLTVQDSSVVVHEGQSFVFVQTAPSTFRRVNVETGESQNGRTVIVSGLDVQAQVVVKGAFLLKSELLLAGTEE
jgi:RND family efflux transporter MFP subunit